MTTSRGSGPVARRMPRWLQLTLAVGAPIAALVMIGLGFWQLARLDERRATNAAILARRELAPLDLNADLDLDPAVSQYRPAVAHGFYDASGEVFWRNQEYGGQPGMHIVTPLRLEGQSEAVLVDRGWLPLTGPMAVDAAAYPAPEGLIEVTGLIVVPPTRTTDLSPFDPVPAEGEAPLLAWFWLDPKQIERQLGYALLPVVLAAEDMDPDGLPRAGLDVALDEGPHLGYAVQWFSFAAITVAGMVAYVWTARRRGN